MVSTNFVFQLYIHIYLQLYLHFWQQVRLEGRRSWCMLSFVGWFQARRQNKTGGLLPYFQRDKYKNAHHAAAFPRHPDSSTVSHEERIEKKKEEATLGRILNPCRLSGGTTRIFFRWKFLSFATDPSTSSSGLHRKRKQGTLFSYPSLSGAICLPEEDGLRCATAEPFFYSIGKKPKGSRVSRCYSDVMHMISSVRSSSLFTAT